ncbi:MAG: PIN domain-containing protein [Acidobacteria bacterium]|nr:PIN domain-containing protein [Acidobacteriota bacterium]
MRVFLDANILFSAAWTDGAVSKLLNLTRAAKHECWVDAYVEGEARRNLLAKSPPAVRSLEAVLRHCRRVPFRPLKAGIEAAVGMLPPDDRLVLGAAIRLRCNALITGDKRHFAPLLGRTVQGVTVYSPASFYVAVILGRG